MMTAMMMRGMALENWVQVMESDPSPLPVLETMKRSMLKMMSAHTSPADSDWRTVGRWMSWLSAV